MAKILGLDLGTNSIGWAVINAKIVEGKVEEYLSIDDAGIRIFPEGVEPTTIGQGDKEQSKNATRREHRQMRRQFYRKKLRKVKLLQTLIELNMCPLTVEGLHQWSKWSKAEKTEGKQFPVEAEFVNWLKLNPYELRAKALQEQISLLELGRIYYHFIQRRGFLSSRKGTEDGALFKGKDNMSGIDATRTLMNGKPLGKTLYDISYKYGEKFNIKRDDEGNELRVRARYTQRDMYIEEFLKIWEKQAATLGLIQREVKIRKVRFLKGTLESKRNEKKLENYIHKYGNSNVLLEGKKVTTYALVPLKEFLAGKIEEQDGELKFKSNDSLLFWQRPLRSQKGLLDNCRFENNMPVIMSNGELRVKNGEIVKRSKKPCPLSHPEFELFRAYQVINNIKYGKGQRLTVDQRQVVMEVFNSKEGNFNFEEIPKALNLTYEKFNYDNDQKIAGNTTIKRLKPLFAEEVWYSNYENIWHYFYFYDDNEKLFEKLKQKFELKKDLETVKKIRLKEGYGNVSLKAIRNINPFLEKGLMYSDAVIWGGIKNAFGEDWDRFQVIQESLQYNETLEAHIKQIFSEQNKEGEAIEKIKALLSDEHYQYGFVKDDARFTQLYHHSQDISNQEIKALVPEVENLRNPIVQQSLHEMRRLVNSLLIKYRENDPEFKFDRIHVEMGRNLKNNKTKRQELTRKIRENEQKNEEARERLSEYGLRPTRDNLLRYLLYREIEKHISGPVQCPYTGKVISIGDLLGGANVIQIEHMIPYSVSLDDSFGNKTLCEATFNNLKAEKTPYEFYLQNHDPKLWGINKHDNIEDGWNEIAERAFKILPYPKARRFTSKRAFNKSDFIERQLNDTRYISRKAVELLATVCDNVRMLPGQVTSELRHLWGINNILNPIYGIDNFKVEVNEEERLTYYIVTDENNNVVNIQRKTNIRPPQFEGRLIVVGEVNDGLFSSKGIVLGVEVPYLKNGKYWAFLIVGEPYSFQPVFSEKPIADEEHIVFKGRIEKQYFSNDTIGKRIKTEDVEDGNYWASFSIQNKEFKLAEGKGRLKTTGSKIALFGEVKDRQFTCHVYHCDTNLPDGKYWALLELNFEHATFIPIQNQKPEAEIYQLLTYANVDENGMVTVDIDPGYRLKTNHPIGRYYCFFNMRTYEKLLFPLENEAPKVAKGERLTEAVVWVDEATGEIKYDPKKNRDDHRHHAIDAITVALTEQSFLQRLSTYHAKDENEKRGIDNSEKFPEPWDGFAFDVKKMAETLLISHKQSNKVLTKISKNITKNGETFKSVGFAARGQLHKETIYGKPKKGEGFHIRKSITTLKDKKQIDKVVDATIRKLILDHLKDNCGINISKDNFAVPKDAFFKDGSPRIFLPNRKGGEPVPVKKVRMRENIGKAIPLKSNINQYVNPRNNHHVLIYEDYNGNLQEDVVPFIEVVERQKEGVPIFQLPEDGKRIITTLEINDMFLLGMDGEIEISNMNKALLNKHLYRVQKVSSGDYSFRYHLASTLNNNNDEVRIRSIKAFKDANPIKVKIDQLGNIKLV